MNRLNIQTAVWLDKTVKTLKKLEEEACHYSQCNFYHGDKVLKDVYKNVENIIIDALDEINAEFEKL